MALITPEQFAGFRPDISTAWEKEEAKIQRCIEEAERVDLYDVLNSLYFDVVENKDELAYQPLMDGAIFTYDGKKSMHVGINKYLAGLAYVRFLTIANATHTAFGYTTKLGNNSEPVSHQTMVDIRKDIQKTNEIEFKRIDSYLKANKQLFPKYSTGNNTSIGTFSIQATTLR